MSNPAYQKRNPSAISRDLTSILAVAGLLLFSWFNLSAVQSAQAEQTNPAATSWIDDDNVSVRLISATNATGMADANSPLIFGLEFQLAENWKVYWRSPGDAGYPPTPDWALSKNVSRADIQWPAPVRFSILGFETLGYKHEVVYPISVIPERPGEAVKLAGEVDFLACADICIPMIAKLALELPSGEASPSSFAHLINKYSVRVPGNGSAHGLSLQNLSLYPAPKDGNPTLSITATSAPGLPFTDPDVFMEGPEGLAYSKPNIVISDDGLKATLFVEVFGAGAKDLTSDDTWFIATLVDGDRFAEQSMPVQLAPSGATPPKPTTQSPLPTQQYSLIGILLIAFLGGLILNLMPCVLPVLSIKLLSVINHGGSDSKTVRLSFLASAAGIIVSFLIIAGALAVLKSTGAAIGWGIQFQQPWFLIIMAVIITVFACNLMGWFEFRLSSRMSDAALKGSAGNGLGGHFATGMLATLLATPCSAPFLGTAVGFALPRGTPEIMVIFSVLGLGLSAPYLLVALAPRLASSLPKPGAWMITLRRILGIALGGTAIWLLSVLTVQIGWFATSLSAAFILAIAIVLYIGHRYTDLPRKASASTVLILSFLALMSPFLTPYVAGTEAIASNKPIDQLWKPFDPAIIDQHVRDGRVVFVDVTADWCITCQVNKTFVLASDTIYDKLSAPGVVAMQADWTLPDDGISQYLASFQRYGIPFNAIYGPGAPQGLPLPELLSQDAVMKALEQAQG